jgi:hypothetical protein
MVGIDGRLLELEVRVETACRFVNGVHHDSPDFNDTCGFFDPGQYIDPRTQRNGI